MKLTVTISARDFELTPAISEMIEKKVEKLDKFVGESATVTWICKKEGQEFQSDVHLLNRGHNYHAHALDHNLYHTFDLVIDKLKEQLQRHHF